MALVRVQSAGFDTAAEIEQLHGNRADIGAVVSFTGYCRDEAGALAALEIEHFPGMAEAEIARIAIEAEGRWPLLGLVAIHRYGVIRPGEPIVLVATASAHRAAAFSAAEFMMDYLKTDAPFWKREIKTNASRPADPTDGWVVAKATDDHALQRWTTPRVDGDPVR